MALVWFFVISVTDWFDGYLARRWNAISTLGQILDPIADKFLIVSVYLVLGLWGFIPLWLTMIVVARDLLILFVGSSILMTRKGQIQLPPQFIGKISTTLQMLFIGFLLIGGAAVPSFPVSSIQSIVMVSFLYIVALTTIVSGIAYAKVAINTLQKP
jgi:cardiolipin synthase